MLGIGNMKMAMNTNIIQTVIVILLIIKFIKGENNSFDFSQCFQNGVIQEIAFVGNNTVGCIMELNYEKTIPSSITNQTCDTMYPTNVTTFTQQTRCQDSLSSRKCVKILRKDIILFEEESLSLDVSCKQENSGRLLVRFESFATHGFFCDFATDVNVCTGLIADMGRFKCPFLRDKFGLSLYGKEQKQTCKNPYFTTVEFQRLPIMSNDSICTVEFNVTALAHRTDITVTAEIIGGDYYRLQDYIYLRQQQTIRFSFLFDNYTTRYSLRITLEVDIEKNSLNMIQFLGASMSPGCFRGKPNDDVSTYNISSERIKLERANHLYVAAIAVIAVLLLVLLLGIAIKFSRKFRNITEVKTSAVSDVISGNSFIEDTICNSNPNFSWYRSSWVTGRINNYHHRDIKIFEDIGNGHFGCVKRGKLLSSSIPVALKELRPYSTAAEKMDFLLEAITLCKLTHPNIVECFGISTSQQHTYILLELMGGDLKNYLRRNRDLNVPMSTTFSHTHSLMLALDVCRACVYLEHVKFIHRDIAARNCLVSQTGDVVIVKIADFGMARDVTMTQYYIKEGSCKVPVRWMSPEAMLTGRFSSKTDVWAFGVLIWEIYTGARLPYNDLTVEDVMKYIFNGGKLDKPKTCPTEMWRIVQMCWLDCAEERPSFRDIEQLLQVCPTRDDEQGSEVNTEETILLMNIAH